MFMLSLGALTLLGSLTTCQICEQQGAPDMDFYHYIRDPAWTPMIELAV